MALSSQQVSVGTAAVNLLAGFSSKGSQGDTLPFAVRNLQAPGGTTIYIGGPNVTSSNGMPLFGGESMPFGLWQSDIPYAVAASGTVTVAVLAGRQS